MASDLVSQINTLVYVFSYVFRRLAQGHSTLLRRTLLQHVEAFDELLLIVLLALSSRGTQ